MNTRSALLRYRILLFLSLVCIALQPVIGDAYSTSKRWPQGTSVVTYRINDNLQNLLNGLAGQQAVIEQEIRDADSAWENVGRFSFSFSSTSCTQFNYNICFDAANLNNLQFAAVTDWGNPPPPLVLNRANVVFNTQHVWHVNGVDFDIYEVSLHEFGHVLGLWDYPDKNWPNDTEESVMWYSGQKTLPYIDDKEATTMLYGIRTQFEVSQFLGLYQTLPFYQQSVHSFGACGSGYPDYWTYSPSAVGIPSSPSGGRMTQFRGCADNNGGGANYAYLPLAVGEHDGNALYNVNAPTPPCGNPCYLQVRNGMNLRWEQYNVTTCTVSIDLEFTDGTTLRDSGLMDTAGDSVHPAQRTCAVTPQGSWFSVTINLSPLAGKTIKRWLLVYDHPNQSGTWRSYIDNLRVTY